MKSVAAALLLLFLLPGVALGHHAIGSCERIELFAPAGLTADVTRGGVVVLDDVPGRGVYTVAAGIYDVRWSNGRRDRNIEVTTCPTPSPPPQPTPTATPTATPPTPTSTPGPTAPAPTTWPTPTQNIGTPTELPNIPLPETDTETTPPPSNLDLVLTLVVFGAGWVIALALILRWGARR